MRGESKAVNHNFWEIQQACLEFWEFGKSSKVIKKCSNMLNTRTALQCPEEPTIWKLLSEAAVKWLTWDRSILTWAIPTALHWVAFSAEMLWHEKAERLNHLFLSYWEVLWGVTKSHTASEPGCTCCIRKENSQFHCYFSNFFPIKRNIFKCWDLSEMSCTTV